MGIFKPTGIDKTLTEESNNLVYPNPAKDYLIFDSEEYSKGNNMTILVYNPAGVLVINQDLLPGTKNIIDVQNLIPGYYIVKIDVNGTQKRGRFIKY